MNGIESAINTLSPIVNETTKEFASHNIVDELENLGDKTKTLIEFVLNNKEVQKFGIEIIELCAENPETAALIAAGIITAGVTVGILLNSESVAAHLGIQTIKQKKANKQMRREIKERNNSIGSEGSNNYLVDRFM